MREFQYPAAFRNAIQAMRKDLLFDDGQISTVRNYNFAILPYAPEEEFRLRAEMATLTDELRDSGWAVGTVRLNDLFIARLHGEDPRFLSTMIEREKHLFKAADPWRGLNHLKEKLANLIEGENGIAKDVIVEVKRILAESGRGPQRTVIFLGRTGALYPFMRTSGLLKHLTGRTENAPVVLLYPGKLDAEGRLSFMGVLPPDGDYRPRIYR